MSAKSLPLLLAVSLATNAAFVGFLLLSRPTANKTSPPAATASDLGQASVENARLAALNAAFASGDQAALAAAGVPPDAIRALTVGRAFDVFQGRMRSLRPPKDERYWRRPVIDFATAREQQLASGKALREFSAAVRLAYGEDLDALFSDAESAVGVLPPAKRERLLQIERDYSEMEQLIQADQSNGVQLPSDRDKLKLLREEKERDIAALLTPAERELIALRDSVSASQVKSRFGEVLKTEEEYKRVYALQKAFDDRVTQSSDAPPTPSDEAALREAQRKLMDEILAVLGPERWAAAEHANDPEVVMLTNVTRRLNLDPKVTNTVLAMRARYADESTQIHSNSDLSPADRSAQIQSLVTKAETELRATLGSEAGPAFIEQATWIGFLRGGQAFSLDPKDAEQSEYYPMVGPRVYPRR
jgi:hypothetical protein